MDQPSNHPIPPQQIGLCKMAYLQKRLARLHHCRTFVAAAVVAEEEQKRRRRTCWVKPWLQRRTLLGQYDTLMQELMRESQGDFRNYMRMDVDMFHEILLKVSGRIAKSYESRPPLSPGIKLAVTLRFLATGNSYMSLAYDFRIAHNTISLFVPEVCDAIVQEYKLEQFQTPATPGEWQEVANKFASRWNFPHCCGALDGKHVALRKPPRGGSHYYNYKGFHSLVLMGLVDADYKFLWANVGTPGSNSDAAIFKLSTLRESLENDTLALPPPDPLFGDDRDTPYFIVGDDAFPLRQWLMKPYSIRNLDHDQRIFNYRLSRARRVVENAFGILACRFR